jgi:hypothetical protein
MKDQNYENHTRFVPGFHIILGLMLLIGTIASFVNLGLQIASGGSLFGSLLISLLFICCLFLTWFTRQFATTVQDRAIRAEESLRYFIITNKALDKKLTINQIIALRFASDEEFAALTERAVNESLSPSDIKKIIKNWRADHHRA